VKLHMRRTLVPDCYLQLQPSGPKLRHRQQVLKTPAIHIALFDNNTFYKCHK